MASSHTATVWSRTGDDVLPVGAHRHGIHRTLMPGEFVQALPGGEVPHHHGPVFGPGDDVPAVWGSPPRNSPHRDAR